MTRLAIIAGQGNLPLQVARAAADQGYSVFIFPIEGQADEAFEGFAVQRVRLGAIGQIQGLFKDHACSHVVMVGKVTWPSLGALRLDMDGAKLLGKLTKRGDDSVLRVVSQFFAENGVKTLPVNMFLEGRGMPSGHVSGPVLNENDIALIKIGISVLDSLGDSDVGQSVIVQNGRILAIEAAEGTSAMLDRSADLIDSDAGPAVFVKMQKRGQDRRLDIPFIGNETIRVAALAGVNISAIEAGAVMLADDLEGLTDTCREYGMTLVGISAKASK